MLLQSPGLTFKRRELVHYHVRWSDSSLDWKPFATEDEASELAEQINTGNEYYAIVERDTDCERCKAFKLKAASF